MGGNRYCKTHGKTKKYGCYYVTGFIVSRVYCAHNIVEMIKSFVNTNTGKGKITLTVVHKYGESNVKSIIY